MSVPTVWCALAGSTPVNAETRRRTAALSRSLSCSIDSGAQNLRLGRDNTVAMPVPAGGRLFHRVAAGGLSPV